MANKAIPPAIEIVGREATATEGSPGEQGPETNETAPASRLPAVTAPKADDWETWLEVHMKKS